MAEVLHKKRGGNRKPLKPKNPSGNETNILPSSMIADSGKENRGGLSLLLSSPKRNDPKQAFAEELQELQGKLQQMQLEKEKAEELLNERDEMLRRKEEEIQNWGKEQEKLKLELKRVQKMKEFQPTMSLPFVQSLGEKEENVDKKKKKACSEMKKPSPPYILWCKDQWSEVKKENPDADFKEISSILGAKWKSVSADEKKPYEERYEAEKGSYLQIVGKEKREKEAMKLLEDEQKQRMAIELLEQYLQFKQEVDTEKKKKTTRKEHDPSKPKHPLSAFFVFSGERRPALIAEKKNVLEIAKIAGEEWKNLTEEQKAPYEEIAMKNKEKYLQEMELYKQKKDEEAASVQKEEEEQRKILKEEALQLLKKKEKTETLIKKTKEKKKKQKKKDENNDPNRPKKPATSFLLFSKETRKELLRERPGISHSTLRALISVRWKELKEEEKETWYKTAAKAMEAYKKEMEEYKKENSTLAADPLS
ncbi:hypothetical protein AAC387_Pa12g1789 [Persea americana]